MSVDTTHTQASLEAYAARVLGDLASALGVSDYTDVVNEALLEYGVTDAADVSGAAETKLIQACVRYRLWTYVTDITNGKFDLTGKGLLLSQINKQARQSAMQAEADVQRYREDLALAAAETDGVEAMRMYTVTRDDDEYDVLASLEESS